MDINKELLGLSNIVNCPVVQDLFEGQEERWIVFTHADERDVSFGDDEAEVTEFSLNISYYTQPYYQYLEDKKKIKKYLKEKGFLVEYIRSWIEDSGIGKEKIRHTVFVISKMDKDE